MVTLNQILCHETGQASRKESTALSLILASQTLQLLYTPWLVESLDKSDAIFLSEPDQLDTFRLDRLHVSRYFAVAGNNSAQAPAWRDSSFGRSLDQLGIVLLELCFEATVQGKLFHERERNGASGVQSHGSMRLAT